MGERLSVYLPRIAVLVLVALGATAGLTFAAGAPPAAAPAAAPAAKKTVQTLLVPDLRNQAFVFAKQQLQDGGFAWRVTGGVQGYAANTVVAQSPAPGTKVIDTGSPLVQVTLARAGAKYAQPGTPEDTSPYPGTPVRLADAPVRVTPAPHAAPKPKAAAKPKPAATPKAVAALPQKRPPAFLVPGARKEPLDEIPLTTRAARLGAWIAAHPKPTDANVKHWLYQNAWVVSGAEMGWWHGAAALRTLVAVDHRTVAVWGIGEKSEAVARRALAEVEARSR
jgi:hypothetical protein